MMYKNDILYARSRLSNTCVSYKGNVVLIRDVYLKDGVGTISFVRHENRDEEEGLLRDVDLKPIPLGYSNAGRFGKYLARKPQRRWKQGVDTKSLVRYSTDKEGPLARPCLADLQYLKRGEYLSLKHILKGRLRLPLAFNRVFAITKDYKIEYKGRKIVGEVLPDAEPVLYKKYFWLREVLEENGY